MDLDDVGSVVDKFRNLPGAPVKARADIGGGSEDENIPDLIIDFGDIALAVDAFRSLPYPFAGPTPCP